LLKFLALERADLYHRFPSVSNCDS
jgi:hypothetical protein